MNILLLAPHPFFSNRGTPIAVRLLAETLGRHGHRLTLLTFAEGEDVDLPNCRLIRIPAVPGTRGMRPGFSAKKLACDAVMMTYALRLMQRERFDLVHAVEESAFMALVMKRLFGAPYVYDMDSSLAQQMVEKFEALEPVRPVLEWFEGHAVRGSSGVLAVCKALADTASGYDGDKLVGRLEDLSLLDEGAEGTEDLRKTIGRSGPLVMYVGNLEAYQGIDLLLSAFQQAVARVADAQLVVIGGAKEHIQRYREQAEALGIAGSTHLVGSRPVEQLGHYLRQADVLVSPRVKGTNTAMKVYSYLDSGRAVLATDLPTHTQVLDSEIALLVEPEPGAMGNGLITLLEDVELRERLGRAARERARQEHSLEAYERKLLGFYGELESRLKDEASKERGRGPSGSGIRPARQ